MTPVHRLFAAAAAGVSLIALTGCISLLPETEPSRIYRLDHAGDPSAAPQPGAPVVVVDRPSASRALASDRVALAYADGRIAYVAGANWASPAPDLMRDLVLDALDAHPDVVGARPEDGVGGRYGVRLELRSFEASGDGAPGVVVTVRARLIDEGERRLVGVRVIEARESAGARRTSDIVGAMERAANRVADETAQWLSTAIAADQAAAG